MFTSRRLVLVLSLLAFSLAEDANKVNSDRSDFKKSLYKDCATSYSTTCLKLDIVSWLDKLNEDDDFSVLPGVSVVRENGSARSNTADIVAELARNFPSDPEARLDAFLMKKVANYWSTHSLKLNLWDNQNSAIEEGRGGGGGGGGGGKGGGGGGGKGGGGMEYILIMGAMMKKALGAIALGGIAAIAKKAIFTAMMSLVLSAVIGLKSLSGGQQSTTYEVISKPIYSHSNSHSSSHEEHGGYGGHYGRSLNLPLPLGLQPNYKPAQ